MIRTILKGLKKYCLCFGEEVFLMGKWILISLLPITALMYLFGKKNNVIGLVLSSPICIHKFQQVFFFILQRFPTLNPFIVPLCNNFNNVLRPIYKYSTASANVNIAGSSFSL